MDLNAFPDPVLRAIFDRVPLLDLGRHIPLVCHRWHSLQPSVLLSKKNIGLTLMIGEDAPLVKRESIVVIQHEEELTNEDGSRLYPTLVPKVALTLNLTTLTSKRVDSMIAKLNTTSVTYLDLCISKTPSVEEAIPRIIRLLDHFARSLKTLKLHCSFSDKHEDDALVLAIVAVQMAPLIESVNKLPQLEHLTLDLKENLRMATRLELPILGRLKEFYFHSRCGKSDYLFGSLKRYAEPNDQLRTIRIGNYAQMGEYLANFSDSSLAKRISMLPNVGMSTFSGTQVRLIDPLERERFLSTFSSLTSLFISMRRLDMVRLTTTLSQLHSLVHLHLGGLAPFNSFDTDPVAQILPLPTVKMLTLVASTSSHKELASKHWGRMFPQMQIIMLYHSTYRCSICKFADDELEPEKVVPCVKKTLLTFKQQFPRTLKKLYYCRNNNKDDVKVFTPDTI